MIEQNPFSVYDFLGYLIPGFFVICFIMLIGKTYDIHRVNESIKYLSSMQAAFIFIILVFSYVTGHFISYLSSMTIERYSIWTMGYPSEYLFGKEVELVHIWRVHKFKKSRYIVRTLNLFLLLPMFFSDLIFGQILRFDRLIAKPLDKVLQKNIENRIQNFYQDRNLEHDSDSDWFRTIYHIIVEESERHYGKMQNYVALYGFNRNISMSLILITWVMLVIFIWKDIHNFESLIILGLLSIIAYTFYCAFNKFYRKFCLEALMALLVNHEC